MLCDRHDPQTIAFRFVDEGLETTEMTFGELADGSRRLATALAARGVARGDRVAVLMSKRRELVVTLLALWRLGALHVPLFTAFAEGAIRLRGESAGARLVVAEPGERAKLAALDVDVLETGAAFDDLVAGSEPLADAVATGGDGPILQLYTSGTTGSPKGVVVPLRALTAFHSYLHYGLDVTADDVAPRHPLGRSRSAPRSSTAEVDVSDRPTRVTRAWRIGVGLCRHQRPGAGADTTTAGAADRRYRGAEVDCAHSARGLRTPAAAAHPQRGLRTAPAGGEAALRGAKCSGR